MTKIKKIRSKERDAVIQSLRAGVVPRVGIHHIQVGRVKEVQALLDDIDRVSDGGSAIRFIIGDYGSGKTFFLYLVKTIAMEKGLVSAQADMTPDRRIHATGGQARNLYAELMRNLSTRTKWDGGALPSVVERFVGTAVQESKENGNRVESIIQDRLQKLSEMVGGYDFAEVVAAYWKGHDTDNEQLKSDAVRWLRGEFSTRTDARNALGVRTIVDDSNVYDYLKLMALFIRLSGYKGLIIGLDEMVNLYKLSNTKARNSNYEQILRILNDSLQGMAGGLGFLMSGTPEFLMDTRRGLYSYEALQSRLAENVFATAVDIVDYNNPVLRLANLSPEDLYLLLCNIRHVFAEGEPDKYLVPDEALKSFMAHCSNRIGDAYFRTPRNTVKAFVDMLSVLDQNSHITWDRLVEDINIDSDSNPDLEPLPYGDNDEEEGGPDGSMGEGDVDDDLKTFKL
jgi:hypothetical protein